MRNIIDFLKKVVQSHKNDVAVVYRDNVLSFQEVDILSDVVAAHLCDMGIPAGELIGIFMEKSEKFVVTALGILKAGCVYLPMDSMYPQERLNYMTEIGNVTTVIVENKENGAAFDRRIHTLDYRELIKQTERFVVQNNNMTETAYVLFTSGSTGNPKGIPITHEAVINLVESLGDYLNPMWNVIGCIAPVVFDMSVGQMYYCLLTGRKLVLVPDDIKVFPDQLLQYLKDKGVESCDITPMHLQAVMRYTQVKNKEFQYFPKEIISSGEALPITVAKQFYNTELFKNSKILNCYGPTETCVYVTCNPLTKHKVETMEQMSIGEPFRNTKVHILNAAGKCCAKNEIGELCIEGIGVSKGYLNRLDLTQKAFVPNPFGDNSVIYRTGDQAKWNEKGELICLGRMDNQVKIRGFRIELDEIEQQILQIEGIQQTKVIVDENEDSKKIVAYYVSNHVMKVEEIKKQLREKLPEYMIPDYLISVPKFEVSVNGKLDKTKLPKYNADDFLIEEDGHLDVEDSLIRICKILLRNNDISGNDNFFKVGGSSFEVIELHVEIFEIWGVSISIADLYDCKNLHSIAELIREELAKDICEESVEELPQEILSTGFQTMLFNLEPAENKKKDRLGSKIPAYNVIHCIEANQWLDPEKLKNAMEEVIKRHSAFNMTFVSKEHQYYAQHSGKSANYFRYITYEKDFSENRLREYASRFAKEKLPLFEFYLFEWEKKQVMMLNIHHAIFDFYSMRIFMDEVFRIYMNKKCRIEKGDFYRAIHNESKKDKKEYFEYWRNYYRNRIECAKFESNTGEDNYRIRHTDIFEETKYLINGQRLQAIRELCKKLGVSEFVFMTSIFALVLAGCSKKEDVILGTYVPGRDKENSNIIGMFTHMIGIRYLVSPHMSLEKYLINQQNDISDIMKNQYIEHHEVYQVLHLDDVLKGELYSVIFNYVNTIQVQHGNLIVKAHEMGEEPEQMPFSLKAFSDDEEIIIKTKYAQKLYSKEYVDNIFKDYFQMINHVLQSDVENIEIGEVLELITCL